ncbi:MAG TPA: glycosyltransferase family 2 protein [Burkholderiales bacterium]|nr:glycosyltransferase family 2 protein [Burkholderiales bacterium]
MSEPLSVVIITYNAERELSACLASAAFADEILVIDSGSTDGTVALAERHGARVLRQKWLGYGPQKQFGATQARHRWILSLDADECVTEALRTSIQAALAAASHAAYYVARRNRFMGRWLKHGEGYPDWIVRLFDRTLAAWNDNPVHEKVVVQGTVGRLKGDLLHESERGIADYLDKQNRYTTIAAATLHAQGRRAGLGKLLLSPPFRFVKFYFLRLGFLDGVPGFVHIAIGCFNSFIKYAKLRALQRR